MTTDRSDSSLSGSQSPAANHGPILFDGTVDRGGWGLELIGVYGVIKIFKFIWYFV